MCYNIKTVKKIFCVLFIVSIILLTPNNISYAQDMYQGAYNSDVNFLENIKNPAIIKISEPIKTEKIKENTENLQILENKLPENNSEEDEYTETTPLKTFTSKEKEHPLFKKMLEKGVIRTDIPTYLLEDELTFAPKKGPVNKIQFIGAYNGYISSSWDNGDYDTNYTNNFIQVGAIGQIRNTKNDFKVLFNPKDVHGRKYMHNFVADAYIVNNSIPNHQIVIGYSRNQVGKEGGSSSYILPFIMRSQIARNFGSTRALGVRLIGNYDLIDYNLAFNSSDRYFHKWFAGPEFTGWVDFKPLGKTNGKYGKLVIGGGLNTGKNHSHYTVGSVYVGYKYKKLWSRFEYGIADGYNGSQVVNKKAEGFYGTVGYKITPKLQIIGRYDQFNPDRNVSGDTRREYTAGINYFLKGQAIKMVLNYVFCQNGKAPDSHRIMLGTQLLF